VATAAGEPRADPPDGAAVADEPEVAAAPVAAEEAAA
jgi:hypothetical protein